MPAPNKFSFKSSLIFFLAFLIRNVYLIYYSTIRIKVLESPWFPKNLTPGQSAIYVFWHAKSFLILPYCRGFRVGLLTLLDWKNEVYGEVCRQYGYRTIALAAPGVAAVELKNFLESGYHVGLALDGPKGPPGTVKPGALHLSHVTGRPIIAINIDVKTSARINHRWDWYEIPHPFTDVTASLSEPFYATQSNHQEIITKIRSFLESR